MKEGLKNKNRNLLIDFLPRIGYKINISENTWQKIEEIKDFLDKNKEVSFIGYFNHICYSDPLLAGHIIDKIDPKMSRHIIAPISYHHMKSKNIGDSTLKMMQGLANWCDVETIPVIQAYQVRNPEKYGYTAEQANITYKKLFNRIGDLRKNNIATGFIISPEGTRSQNGVLEDAEKGMILIGKMLEPVLFIPIGISYNQEFKRNRLNFGKSLNLEIGETYFYEKGGDKKDINFYMKNLAEILPENMRGKWAQMPDVRK